MRFSTSKSHEHYLAILLEHMLKKFVIKSIKIKGGCQSESKVVTHNSKSDWPLAENKKMFTFHTWHMRCPIIL